MEGRGAYNKHGAIQAAGVASALPLLEKAVRNMELGSGESPIVIADYGSSQGKNSLAPMRIAIKNLRQRVGPKRPMLVFHIDQRSNDFNSLFEMLARDPESQRPVRGAPKVFPCAIGRSFYEQVVPCDSVHLAWSSYAAVWLSSVPTLIAGHIRAGRGTESERAAFQRQAAEDWKNFVSLKGKRAAAWRLSCDRATWSERRWRSGTGPRDCDGSCKRTTGRDGQRRRNYCRGTSPTGDRKFCAAQVRSSRAVQIRCAVSRPCSRDLRYLSG